LPERRWDRYPARWHDHTTPHEDNRGELP
jgi:hypothetical protein